MQRDAQDARLVTAAAKAAGAVAFRPCGQVREKRASGRQLLQHFFECRADGELRQRVGFLPKIGNRPRLPVNILGLEIRGVALRRAGFPKQFQKQFPFGLSLVRQNALVFVQRDAAPVFGFVFGPEIRRDNRHGNPA